MPIAATTQRVAAVVSPRTESPSRMIAPAPRNPIPVTICAAMRVGSARTTVPPCVRNAWKPYAETIVKSAEPSDPLDDPDRDRGDRAGQRLREPEFVERAPGCDVRAGDRGAPRAAVGLQHVAVEIHRALAECLEVDDAAQRSADQTLDLDRAAALLATRSLA